MIKPITREYKRLATDLQLKCCATVKGLRWLWVRVKLSGIRPANQYLIADTSHGSGSLNLLDNRLSLNTNLGAHAYSMSIQIGDSLPDITLPANDGKQISLHDFKGKHIVLYFYPKDSTPGCTTQGQNFRDAKADFDACNTVILGASKDSVKRHENFIAKQSFNFDLLSDEDEVLCKAFDVIKLKKMYGKEFEGIERSTFLFDANGTLKQEWRKVKVNGHVEEVLAAAQAL